MSPELAKRLAARRATQPLVDAAIEASEDNDCTVRALSILSGKPYATAHAELKKLGRVRGRGLTYDKLEGYLEAFKALGTPLERVRWFDNVGKYLVLTTSHAIAMVDGVAVNGLGGTKGVLAVYKA